MSVDDSPSLTQQFPESLFRVGIPREEGEYGCTPMTVGPWMNDPDGNPAAGSIGVLFDDAVGHQIFLSRGAGQASVTSELSLDLLVAPPWSTVNLRAKSRMLYRGEDGGFAECRVFDDTDRLVAAGTSWCRYVPLPAGARVPESEDDWNTSAPLGKDTLFDVLGARYTDTGVVLAPSTELTNPLGVVHGGVLVTSTELAAKHVIAGVMGDPVTTSVRMNYLRPAVMDAELTLTAEIVHRGRSVSVAKVTSSGASGKAFTLATVTCRRALARDQ